MKRFFAPIGIGFVLALSVMSVGVAVYPQAAFAQSTGGSGSGSSLPLPPSYVPPPSTAAPTAPQAQVSADKKQTPPNTQGSACSVTDISSCFGLVMSEIASLFAWLLGVAMLVLDASVYYTVVKMGNILKEANGITAIPILWRVMRDFGNIALIFGFLAIGFETILGVNFYGGTKLLPTLIIIAVLLNFSLFFASAVVDVSNLFATEFYAQINDNSIPSPSQFDTSLGAANLAAHREGVSNAIMDQLGLQSLYGEALNNSKLFTGGNQMLIGFLGSLLFIIASFVMFSLAFILISRFVILVVLLIISPVGIAAYAVPQLKARGKQWWDMLLAQSITAPVLLLLLYVALRFITDAHFITSFVVSGSVTNGHVAQTAWTGAAGGGDLVGFSGILLAFLIAMGLLLAVTMVAKSMSAWGASAATKIGGLATFGAISLGMRSTFGMAGAGLNSKRLQAAAAEKGAKGFFARNLAVRPGRFLSTSTFDMRNLPGAGKVQKMTGVDAGKGATLTAQKVVDNKTGHPLNVVTGWKPIQERARKEMEGYKAAKRDVDFADAQNTIEQAKQQLKSGAISQAEFDRVTAAPTKVITDGLAKMSTKELEELGGIKKGVSALVENLSPQKFDALMKSDKLSEEQRNKLSEVRFANVNNLVATASKPGATVADIEAAQKEVAKLNQKEIVHANNGFLTNPIVAQALTNDQYDALGKDGGLAMAEKAKIDQYRKNRYDPTAAGSTAKTVADSIKALKWNRDAINKLPSDTLTNTLVLNELGLDALNLIDVLRRGNLSPVDRQKVGAYLENVATNAADPRQTDFAVYLTSDPRVKRDLLIP